MSARTEEGRCVLTAYRKSPEETVRVAFLEPSIAMALELQEEVGFVLTGSEKDMQSALARNPQLIEEGLTVLDRELISSVGDIDLYARDSEGRFVVVELKRGKATQEAVHQLQRYVQAVQPLVPNAVRGILAAPAITHPARVQLERLQLEFKEIQALPKPEEAAAQPALF
ncbi:endonuclease NucS domain-containing protein [Deinococcus peraridilitoris]|uniref:endonuclease NucS domain-containing protein n=1 Tax=Deinococcus peraridilitoris TaxID=432329 RepID=UPI00247FE4E5|nr:endonuclease NucS domain-containing protein [Deinococcus peraridilitoris]